MRKVIITFILFILLGLNISNVYAKYMMSPIILALGTMITLLSAVVSVVVNTSIFSTTPAVPPPSI